VVASHYAEPLLRHLKTAAPLMSSRESGAETLGVLDAGMELQMLDCSLGWAWGYAGPDRRVGYIRADAIDA
jgi:hypothetical protein